MFPVEAPALRARLHIDALAIQLQDNVKARALQPDGSYQRVERPGPAVRSQAVLLETARASVGTTPNPNEAAPSFRSVN